MNQEERELCWAAFACGAGNRRHAFRTPVVMSMDEEGYPNGRVLTLREANAEGSYLRFHLDRRSPKFAHWTRQPVAAAVFYDAAARWQIRVKALAELHSHDEVAREAWNAGHPMSKRTYLTDVPPGGEVDWDDESTYPEGLELRRPTEEESEAGYQNFAVLLCRVLDLDSLRLRKQGHQRIHIVESSREARRVAP
jgi:pyridoxamine 5'-phosphate oxidase